MTLYLWDMPLPSHVNRLLSEILSETPERALSRSGEIEANKDKLAALGFDVHKLMNCRWSDQFAVTFAVDAKYHVVMWLANSPEDRAFQHMDMDDYFTGVLRDDPKAPKGVVGMEWKKYKQLALWHRDFFSSGERTDAKMMMGRLWRREKFVSFWNPKADVMKEWRVIEDFIANMKLDPRKCVYEFIDQMEVQSYDEATEKDTAIKDIDPEILRQMHTSPEIKKALLGTDSGKKQNAMDQFMARQSDGHVRLGDLLTEDPDTLDSWALDQSKVPQMKALGIDVNRIERGGLWHDQHDAVPFQYDVKHNVVVFSVQIGEDEQPTHLDLSTVMALYVDHPDLFRLEHKPYGWTITPIADAEGWEEIELIDFQICPVSFVHLNSKQAVIRYVQNDATVLGDPGRKNPSYVLGRMWSKVPAISFWAEMQRVMRPLVFDAMKDLLKEFRIDPTKAVYEFLDQERLFLFDDLSVPEVSKMSKAELMSKMAKQHLDPQAKRDLNKGVEHPDKFGGMLPAKYHAASNTSDGIIKLGDLLK